MISLEKEMWPNSAQLDSFGNFAKTMEKDYTIFSQGTLVIRTMSAPGISCSLPKERDHLREDRTK